MIIQPYIFDLLFYTIVMLIGIDFTLSGWLALRKGIIVLERLRLLGLLILRAMNKLYDDSQGANGFFKLIYSFTYMRVNIFISGVLIIIMGLLLIFDTIFQLFL